jgi:hypothetical protein
MDRFSRVLVQNESNERVSRGGKTFRPNERREVYVTDVQRREIKAHQSLFIIKEDGNNKNFTCPICTTFACSSKTELKKHVMNEHPKEYARAKNRR